LRTLLTLLLCLPLVANAQTVTGRWTTIDDETGKRRSVVEITERDGKLHGRIVQLFRDPGEDQDPTCTKCAADDDRYGKKIIGMEIIRGMIRDGEEWNDGDILDPKNGSVYDCKLWLEDGKLKVRGYVAFFFRTQTWVREQSKF
jgi:uncharacterized protein (DUF2147 family)